MERNTIGEAIDFFLAWREQSTHTLCVCLELDKLSVQFGLPCSCTGRPSPFRRDSSETKSPPSEG